MKKMYYYALLCVSLLCFAACSDDDEDVDVKGTWELASDPISIKVESTNGSIVVGDEVYTDAEIKDLLKEKLMNFLEGKFETLELGEKGAIALDGNDFSSFATFSCSGNRCYVKVSDEILSEFPTALTSIIKNGIALDADRVGDNLTLTITKSYLIQLFSQITDEKIEQAVREMAEEDDTEEDLLKEMAEVKMMKAMIENIVNQIKDASISIYLQEWVAKA